MPYDDYKRSRSLSLTISIFSDGSIFEEIFGLARVLEIEKSNLLSRIHASATEKMADIYERFHQDEERNFFAN